MSEDKKPQEQPLPEFIQKRLEVFARLEDRTPKPEAKPIKIKLLPLNGPGEEPTEEIDGVAGETLPVVILKDKFKGSGAFSCVVNGAPWDLKRPVVEDCTIAFINFDHPLGKSVFWHSSAHVLGAAIEMELGVEIATGPATENGFFYDFDPVEKKIDQAILKKIEDRCIRMCKQRAEYERKMITVPEALELFSSNKYKQEILRERVTDELVAVYKTGTFVDLCRGPHIINADILKSWWVTDVSGAIWAGDASRKLNRIRAVTYPTPALMKEYKAFLEEAEKRNHRTLGLKHELYFFHPWSPGCAFWYPDGCHIYRKLMEMIRDQYKKRNFVEVITPNIYYQDLFETSGHWTHYRDDMFHFVADEEDVPAEPKAEAPEEPKADGEECQCCAELCRKAREMGLKPMNCPGHCLVFRSRERSYRELPIRMAEFGVLHRNEATGALSGLTRVRRFVQDDAHIFCRRDQIGAEIANALDFMKTVYDIFGMNLEFTLSTINMDKYMGDLELWEEATEMLRKALVDGGHKFREEPGEAAFYGPKIDCQIKDCIGRKHQLATVQLDFQLPLKFNLHYVDSERKEHTPVMIHRAVLGSLERFIGIAVEHFCARFPFWMSPHQIALIPQNDKKPEHLAHCEKLWKILHDADFTVTIDDSAVSMAKKIVRAREFQLAHAILVIGDQFHEFITLRFLPYRPLSVLHAVVRLPACVSVQWWIKTLPQSRLLLVLIVKL